MRSPARIMRRLFWKITIFAPIILFLTVFTAFPVFSSSAFTAQKPVGIGVLAYRGANEALKMRSTTADYLSAAIPPYSFSKDFRVGPNENDGMITLSAVARRYWYWLVLGMSVVGIMAAVTMSMLTLNRQLAQSRQRLEEARNGLEQQVRERTAELEKANEGLSKEVAERKLAEETIARSAREWSRTFDAMHDPVAMMDNMHRIVRMNKAMAEKLGISPKDAVGAFCYNLVHGQDGPIAACPYAETLADGNLHSRELSEARMGGDYLVSVSPVWDEKGGVAGCVHVMHDITARKRAEREREAARMFLQSVIDGVSEPIMVIGTDYHVQMMNRAARETHSPDDSTARPRSCFEISHHRDTPCDSVEVPCPLKTVVNTRQSVVVTHRHKGRDGNETYYEILASPVFNEAGEVTRVIETCRDSTSKLQLEQAQKKLDEQFYREQKEQSIIALAGGIAHDFNNGLMGMLGNAELLKMNLSSDSREQALIRNILASGQQMADLTRQLLAYAKGGRYLPEVMFLDASIQEALGLTRKGKAADREVVLDIAQDLLPVFADAGQITQVFVNLFTNAFEAMEGGNGALTVHAANVWRDAWECSSLGHGHPAGKYVHVRISDRGPGIPPELHKRIFEPFFTTKFMGRGLGLAATVGIIQNHQGCISVESEPGKGTAFHIYLPVVEEHAHERKMESMQAAKLPMSNSILVVDDDPQIQTLVESMLTQMGKQVYPAGSGAEALEVFKKKKNSIALAILDIQMPDMDGKTLFRKLKALKPELKVLISSGYDEATALEGLGAKGPEGFIQKPYWINTLEEKVTELLHGPHPT